VKDILNLERVLRTPRALLAMNEVNVSMWHSTPLIGGSVWHTPTQFSFIANALRGVLLSKRISLIKRLSPETSTERQHEVTL
jgi:hypothetical protein